MNIEEIENKDLIDKLIVYRHFSRHTFLLWQKILQEIGIIPGEDSETADRAREILSDFGNDIVDNPPSLIDAYRQLIDIKEAKNATANS